MNIPEEIQELIEGSPLGGICCQFVSIDDEWGIKAYWDEENRDRSFYNQIEYEKLGFAPPVGDCFDIGGNYCCYSTRVAKIIWHPYSGVTRAEAAIQYKPQINKATSDMNRAGLYPKDLHVANWGIFEGKMMLIDFGMDS